MDESHLWTSILEHWDSTNLHTWTLKRGYFWTLPKNHGMQGSITLLCFSNLPWFPRTKPKKRWKTKIYSNKKKWTLINQQPTNQSTHQPNPTQPIPSNRWGEPALGLAWISCRHWIMGRAPHTHDHPNVARAVHPGVAPRRGFEVESPCETRPWGI